MAQYRKKPVVIEAWQLGSKEPRPAWCKWTYGNGHDYAVIVTREGTMRAERDDWIIKGVRDELYPCKPDIFAETYEPVITNIETGIMSPNEARKSLGMGPVSASDVDPTAGLDPDFDWGGDP